MAVMEKFSKEILKFKMSWKDFNYFIYKVMGYFFPFRSLILDVISFLIGFILLFLSFTSILGFILSFISLIIGFVLIVLGICSFFIKK